jgi:hypothetical protein
LRQVIDRAGNVDRQRVAPPLLYGSSTNLEATGEHAMTTKNLTIALAFALSATAAGCAATAPGQQGGDDGSDQGSGSDPGDGGDQGSDDAPTPLILDGHYDVSSSYDLATNMPGTAGDVVNQFIDATDDADDPSKYLCDLLIAQLSGSIKTYAQDAEDVFVGYLNDELLNYAPGFVDTILEVGKDFGDVAKNFDTIDTWDVASGVATHTITGVKFTVEGTDMEFSFAD